MAEPPTPRARQIVAVARELLEQEGPAALTMRRLGERLGIRAPSLYKHLPDKAALEAAIIATGFEDAAAAFEHAVEGAADPLAAFTIAYRAFALARAVFAFAHGMVLLELTRRLPPGGDPEAAWQEGIAAFQARTRSAARSDLR
jgi:AcrR family transcriptional regulator